jgi:ankyrin repeat protein/uncharacterized protein DUF4375
MKTPLQQIMAAVCDGTMEQIRGLLDRYPEVFQEEGAEILKYAAERNRVDVLDLLMPSGGDVDGPEEDESLLATAAGAGALAAARWLIDRGADINKNPTGFGTTPLLNAVQSSQLDMVELLLDRGADPDALDGNPQRNSLAMARLFGQDDIADLLQARGVSEIVVEADVVDIESEVFFARGKDEPPGRWFEQGWPDVYDFARRNGLESMSERNRVFFLAGYLITILADGGAEAVYGEPSGEFTGSMPVALERIGARRAAELVRQINAFFPGGAPASDHEDRRQQMAALPSEVNQLGEMLDAVLRENITDGQSFLVSQLHAFYHSA